MAKDKDPDRLVVQPEGRGVVASRGVPEPTHDLAVTGPAVLRAHDEIVRDELQCWDGREVDTSDDGFFASFAAASAAIACAWGVRDRLGSIGIEMRSGVHAGEFQTRGARLGGVAVAVGARISAAADTGEILVSRTVRDLVVGSGIRFADRGLHSLKGVPGRWQLYAVDSIGA